MQLTIWSCIHEQERTSPNEGTYSTGIRGDGARTRAPPGCDCLRGAGLHAVAGELRFEGDLLFFFQYNDSATVGVDTGCATQNDITARDVPGLIAQTLHVSCSDTFTNGIPKKSQLGDPNRRVVAYFISKDGGKKTCNIGTPLRPGGPGQPPPGPVTPPPFVEPKDCGPKETYYLFEYNDSATVGVDSGCATQNDVPGRIAKMLHVSCSDTFTNGIPKKSDLGDPNRRVVAYFISKDGGKKTCGIGTPITAGGVPGSLIALGALAAGGAAVQLVRRRRKAALVP